MIFAKSIQKIVVFFICVSICSIPLFLHAEETPEELQGTLSSLSEQIKSLDAEIKTYSAKIGKTQGEAKTLKQALINLEAKRSLLSKDIDSTKLRILRAQENISFTKGKIQATETVLDRNRKALAESLRLFAQSEQFVPQYVSALAPNAHISDALDVLKRGGEASRGINQKVRTLTETKTMLSLQKASYESRKNTLEDLNETLAGQKKLVEQTSKDKSLLLVQTKNKESEYQKLVQDRREKKDKLEVELLDVESKLKVFVDASKLPLTGKGVLQYPVKDVVITQYFGNTPFASKNAQIYNGAGHNGIDLGVRLGTPVYSAGAGVVLGTGNTDSSCVGVSYGKWVLIRHTNGLTTLYAHLSAIQVTPGQTVTSRQKIALSGSTGYSTGPHLHFSVYASDSVRILGPTEYKSKVCGTNMVIPVAPRAGYLNPLSYL